MKSEESKNEFIGKHIKAAREEAKLSQLDLAKILEFGSATAISLIESGARGITIENLEKIAKALQKDIKYFLGQPEDKVVDIQVALRADKDLTKQDQDAILHLIQLARDKRHGK